MTTEVVDLLPRDAEVARRAAGGDGAAFVRLYDEYSSEVFAVSLAATGSVEAAADATQTAFLRLLRWPPALGAPDSDVAELLCALALGGGTKRGSAGSRTSNGHASANAAAVGWLRSETVASAGARFDEDWSGYLWSPPATPVADPDPVPDVSVQRPRRRRVRILPRLALPFPAPAATAALVLAVFAGAGGTMLASGGTEPMEAAPAAATSEPARETAQPDQRQRAEIREGTKPRRLRFGEPKLLRQKTLGPLLAP